MKSSLTGSVSPACCQAERLLSPINTQALGSPPQGDSSAAETSSLPLRLSLPLPQPQPLKAPGPFCSRDAELLFLHCQYSNLGFSSMPTHETPDLFFFQLSERRTSTYAAAHTPPTQSLPHVRARTGLQHYTQLLFGNGKCVCVCV